MDMLKKFHKEFEDYMDKHAWTRILFFLALYIMLLIHER